MEVKHLGVKLGKISTFMKKVNQAKGTLPIWPVFQGHDACLTWHTQDHCWEHCDNHKSNTAPSKLEKESSGTFITEGLKMIK
jgi:hypothetical protein